MSSHSTSGCEPGAGFRLLRLATAPAGTAVAELLVPADSPIFAGHFPGRPLLPGIAHLALLRQVLDELAARGGLPGGPGVGTAITEVRRLRLRRPVLPGDRIELRLPAIDAAGVRRFEVRRQPAAGGPGGELASEGTVRIGAGVVPAAPPGPRAPGARTAARDFPPASELLPHTPPARLLAAVLAVDAGGVAGTGVIHAAHPLAAGGEAPGFLAIELAAQAAAVLEALSRPPGGQPRIGYLVGVRGAHLVPTLPTGRTLRVTAIPAGGAAALATYDIRVEDEAGERLATGTISTFLPDP
jgi:3-hydroxyacyl-[acyl-carrier-protein] dehydratase